MKLDRIDIKILETLQEDGRITKLKLGTGDSRHEHVPWQQSANGANTELRHRMKIVPGALGIELVEEIRPKIASPVGHPGGDPFAHDDTAATCTSVQ